MIQALTSFRFLFMLLIVLFHLIGKRFEFGGDCGVAFFFMLSGFVLSLGYGKQVAEGSFEIFPFVKRQLAKFYPLHLLMLVLIALLDARLERYYEWYQLLPSVLLLQSWFPFDSIIHVANASSWFLCALLFSYILFPLLFRLLSGLSIKRLMLLSVGTLVIYAVIISIVPESKINNVVCLSPALRVLDFCIGILLFRLFASQYGKSFGSWLKGRSSWQLTIIEVLPLCLVLLSYFVYGAISPRLRCASLFWITLPPLFLVYAKADQLKGKACTLLHNPVLLWLGSISMEIYLTHGLTIRLCGFVARYLEWCEDEPDIFLQSLYVPIIILVAYGFHRWFVQPVQQLVCRFK